MKNEALFKQNLTILCEIFDKPLSQLLTGVYWKTLEPFSDSECERAFKELMLSSRFFPKPADFIERLTEKQEDQATRAWISVVEAIRQYGNYQSVRFADPVVHSVLEFMGGWGATGEWLDSELKWKQKEFERLYNIMLRNEKHPEYLPGICEIDNSARGFATKTDVVQIGFHDETPMLTAVGG